MPTSALDACMADRAYAIAKLERYRGAICPEGRSSLPDAEATGEHLRARARP